MDSCEKFIDDVDKSLQSAVGTGLKDRLSRIDASLAALVDRPLCFCKDIVETLIKTISQIEKNVALHCEARSSDFVHSVFKSFLSSADDMVHTVNAGVTGLVDERIEGMVSNISMNVSSLSLNSTASTPSHQKSTGTQTDSVTTDAATNDTSQAMRLSWYPFWMKSPRLYEILPNRA